MSRPTKACPKCGRVLLLNGRNFVRTKHPRKPGRWLYKHCRACERKRQAHLRAAVKRDPVRLEHTRALAREKNRRSRAAQPEKHREWQRNYRDRLKADPERYAEIVLLPLRFRVEHERKRPGRDTYRPPSAHYDVVDAGPFLEFLRSTFPGWAANELAELTGHAASARRLQDILACRQTTIELPTVDRFLTRGLGRPDLLNALYPWGAAA